ncbi:MAG: aminopeptidase N, partial [Actinobacteria bacterium]|nr:aminopeptidase N [Actinomycetota bacterium]
MTRDEARARAALLSAVGYEVAVDLEDGDTFTSQTVVRFDCAEPGASTFVDLDARGVSTAELNGRTLPAAAFTGHRLELDDLRAHNELRVGARCAYRRTGAGLHRFVDPVDGHHYLHTQFEPFDAHRVYACFDQPDLKARFTLTVRAPAGWEVVSNGAVLERPTGGEPGTWRFAPTPPVSPYITALVAGPFHAVRDRHAGIDLGVFCRQSLLPHLDVDEILTVTRQGFDFFTGAFDYPYPFGKYDQLFVPEFNFGAMENAGCVTLSESYVFRSKVTDAARQGRAGTILHEMAHMWFGDLVTMRWWDDLWLNESFATYMGTLALAEATRFRDAWAGFAHGVKAWAYQQDQLPSTHPIVADNADTNAVRVSFDGITYAKGASVLKQLVAWVGRDAFMAGLRGYFRRHEYANATLADFLAALEQASGRDLGAWSRQWLETAGVATLRPEAQADGDTYRSLAVLQEAPARHPTLRAHRLALGLYGGDGDRLARRRRLELDVAGRHTPVREAGGQAVPDLLLVNDDDLAYAKVRLDERSLATLDERLSDLEQPLARALCWSAAWDMTRDAELATRRWVRLVVAHAARETDITLLQTLLGQARAAIDRYGDPANRPAARALLAGRAREELAQAPPGSDAQLVWARTWVSAADSPDDLGRARALLGGAERVEGLAVDTDLRWHIVTALAAAGDGDEALVAGELERDPTDFGARRAAAARAARPDGSAKTAAWEALTGGGDLTLAMMRALASGFWQPGQEELLAGWVDR